MNGLCMCGAGWQGEDCSVPFFVPGADMPGAKGEESASGADAGGAALGLLANSPSNTDLQAPSIPGDTSTEASELLPQPSIAGMSDSMPLQEQPIQTQAPIDGLFEGTEIADDPELDGRSMARVSLARPDSSGSLATAASQGPSAAGSAELLGSDDTGNLPPNGL